MALARALAVEPSVLLLDEPFGALDANVRADLRAWLRRMHEQVPVTTVLVTHDQEEAMELADRIVLLKDGQIAQVGAPRELYDDPADSFVMSFLGRVSKLDGKLVRPHDVTLSDRPEDGWEEAMVQRVVHLGFEVRVEVVRGDGEEVTAQLTRARGRGARAARRLDRLAAPAGERRQRLIRASGSSPRRRISSGRLPLARSASVTCSTTARTLARTAIQMSCRSLAGPGYSTSSGASPRTAASGPSTARMTSASVMSSAGWASQ